MVTADQPGLFGVAELAPRPDARRVEAGLHRALAAGLAGRIIGPADAALAAAALATARALDRAEALPDKTAVYAIAQLLPPFQRALHGLRLPAELTPATVPAAEPPAGEGADAGDWLSDQLGPS